MVKGESLQPGAPDYERMKLDWRYSHGCDERDTILDRFVLPYTELPEVRVMVEWTANAALVSAQTRKSHERALDKLFAHLELQGIAGSFERVGIYRSSSRLNTWSCVIIQRTGICSESLPSGYRSVGAQNIDPGTNQFEDAIHLHRLKTAVHRTQREVGRPWRSMYIFESSERVPELLEKGLFGCDPQLVATARM